MGIAYAVILAGGKGERFWPYSTTNRPKQFLKLFSHNSLIRNTKERLSRIIPLDRQIYVLREDLVGLLKKEIPELKDKNILKEPLSKNTAPAIALSAWYLRDFLDAVMVVLPADHYIKKVTSYRKDLRKAIKIASKYNSLVTFGITPSYPATGYGYIEVGEEIEKKIFRVKRFTEKPSLRTAKQYLKKGNYFWNSGMFVWRVKTILSAFEKYMPDLYKYLKKVNFNQRKTIEMFYKKAPSISIDYGIMEKAENITMIKADFIWDDLGSWLAVERHGKKIGKNTGIGNFYSLDSEGCIVVNEDGVVAILGVKNLIVVKYKNKILVADKKRAEDVKKIAKIIEKR